MKSLKYIFVFFFMIFSFYVFGQDNPLKTNKQDLNFTRVKYNPLSPAKAAFYSAILPGAGQVYNNRYWWQLPAIYGGLGLSTYYFVSNDNQYGRFRTAFKRLKAGLPHEFDGKNGNPMLSESALMSAQKQIKKNRDLSLLSIVLVYVLQIVEASVSAHLLQFDTNDNISLQPMTVPNYNFESAPKVGLRFTYTF